LGAHQQLGDLVRRPLGGSAQGLLRDSGRFGVPVSVSVRLRSISFRSSPASLGLQLIYNAQGRILRLLLLLGVVDAAEGGSVATLGLLVLLEYADEVFQRLVHLFVFGGVQTIRSEVDVPQRSCQLATHLVADVLHDEIVLVVGLHIDLF
jgi:hypothetical protein